MKKRRKYSDNISAKDWIERTVEDIWSGIKELQRLTGIVLLISLLAVFLNTRSFKRLIYMISNKITNLFKNIRK